jgi:rhodanese-related sulfurtransferase
LIGRLLVFDALAMTFRELRLRKDPACPLCGERPSITELQDYDALCGVTSANDEEPAAGLEIGAREAAELMGRPGGAALIDVREPHEYQIARLEGAVLIPLRSLPARLAELDRSRPMVVYCHHGQRSLHAAELLRGAGFAHATSMRGGIDAWSHEVDPAVPRY